MSLSVRVKKRLIAIFWWCISVLLWTPADVCFKYASSRSKWLYFRFQSSQIHSQVALITGIHVPFNIAFFLLLYYSNINSAFLLQGPIPYAILSLLVVTGSLTVKKFCPIRAYKIQYFFLFLAFFVSFNELYGVLYSTHFPSFETQLFSSLFFLLMVITLLFQWSTLITSISLFFFGGNFILINGKRSRNVSEVSN